MKKRFFSLCLAILWITQSMAQALPQPPSFLSESHAMQRIETVQRYLLLPVEEKEENARISIIVDNKVVKQLNCRLAVDNVDYYVPLDLSRLNGQKALLDIVFPGNRRQTGAIRGYTCWQKLQYSNSFDITNREHFRPLYHHTPAYGWMNDPNGMFYMDGVWHLYYQFNPYGSQWENMTWGHSTSTDLIHWTQQPDAIEPDGLGTIFSGNCVVDHNNTAGFGRNAVVAIYTTAGVSQTQSLAHSEDHGMTFHKYAGNPVITGEIADFRDPKMFWNEATGRWNLVLAAGQEIQIYSSKDLKAWQYESSFGHGYGNHSGVWECPDLVKLPVEGTGDHKWALIVNINPGGPHGGSATQYFIGSFDGHQFTCDSKPAVTKWMDYGKDHYATVTFNNAPEGRTVAMAWMSNWQYANQVPTRQYRAANSLPRDLYLFRSGDETYMASNPSREVNAIRGRKLRKLTDAAEIEVAVRGSFTLILKNGKGEQVVMEYDADSRTFAMDRTRSGEVQFSDAFPARTVAPTFGPLKTLRLFIDRSSIEAFGNEGKMAMTNLVFPSEPYSQSILKGSARQTIYELK